MVIFFYFSDFLAAPGGQGALSICLYCLMGKPNLSTAYSRKSVGGDPDFVASLLRRSRSSSFSLSADRTDTQYDFLSLILFFLGGGAQFGPTHSTEERKGTKFTSSADAQSLQ